MSDRHYTPASDIRVSGWLSRILYPLARYVVLPTYFGKIRILGRENVPKTGPVLVAPTHRSRWDAILVPFAVGRITTGRDVHFMVSANEANAGVQGWFVRHLGGFPVDTENPGTASIRTSVELLEQDRMLTVFPEGDIFRTEEVQPLKPGVARMAQQAQSRRDATEPSVKILPVALQYSQEYPGWGCEIEIRIGESIDLADYDLEKPKTSAKQISANLKTALDTLTGNCPQSATPIGSSI